MKKKKRSSETMRERKGGSERMRETGREGPRE